MSSQEALIEVRFGRGTEDCIGKSEKVLEAFGPEKSEAARDPTIVAALTVAGAAISLAIELIKLAKELRSNGKKQGIVLVKIDKNNRETSLPLLEKSDDDIKAFVEGD
jgi:hypothetical protein